MMLADFFAYIQSLGLEPSDWMFFALTLPVGWFLIRYGLMTKWWVHPLGWFVLMMAVGFAAILSLIAFAVFAGQRVDEFWRFLIMVLLFIAWVGKDIVLERERYAGRIEARRRLRDAVRVEEEA
jgi:hypothetical protein